MKVPSLLAASAAALLTGCGASTTIVTRWEATADRGPPCVRMLVVGVTPNASVRRVFEDEMVKVALARGVASANRASATEAWGPAYAYPPQVAAHDTVYAEVRLFRVRPDELAWVATTETFAPTDVRKESAAFAQLVFRQLAERKLI